MNDHQEKSDSRPPQDLERKEISEKNSVNEELREMLGNHAVEEDPIIKNASEWSIPVENIAGAAALKPLAQAIPIYVRTPKGSFVRIHLSQVIKNVGLVQYGDPAENFIIRPELLSHPALQGMVAVVDIHLALVGPIRNPTLSLWLVRVLNKGGIVDSWCESLMECRAEAYHKWITIRTDLTAKRYYGSEAEDQSIEPKWPEELDLLHFFNLSFKDHQVTDENHPLIRDLEGKRPLQ